jgi:hypothetical protein
VATIDEKMKKSHLRWFGHVQRKIINTPVKKSELIQVGETERKKKNNITRSSKK